MKKNLFEMGSNFDDGWSSDNKIKSKPKTTKEIKNPEKHQLHFAKEKRRGKVVTIVKPFLLNNLDLKSLLKALKKELGTGGTAKDNSLEFQGDIESKLRVSLSKKKFRLK